MLDQITICNQALSRLAAQRIESFNDNTIAAKECAAIWTSVITQVQAKGPWMCNKFRVQLPQVSTTPLYRYAYAYQLPVNPKCLRVLDINEQFLFTTDYKVENNLLLINSSVAQILYIGLVTDPSQFDAFLEEAIEDELVARLAKKITGSQQEAQAHRQYADENRDRLIALSELQGTNDPWPNDSLIKVRFW